MLARLKIILRSQPPLLLWLLWGGVLLLLVAAFLWWHTVSIEPRRVFWGMVQNNLSTQSVTLQSTQEKSGTTTKQFLQLDFGPQAKARSYTAITRADAVVKTENLSTIAADYTRYVSIQNKGRDNPKAKQLVGVWANTTDKQQPRSKDLPPLFGQVLLSRVLPIGNLKPDQRQTLAQAMKADNVYDTSFSAAKKRHTDGRLQYVYSVKLQPILYIRLMKTYAKMVNLHDLDDVDPNTYSGAAPITVQFIVDARARQLVGIDYGDNKESYSGYGVPVRITAPAHAISGEELQKRLGVLQ